MKDVSTNLKCVGAKHVRKLLKQIIEIIIELLDLKKKKKKVLGLLSTNFYDTLHDTLVLLTILIV